jgi:aryl-alcohol dehydrogenase-like predicted oxidoreductase
MSDDWLREDELRIGLGCMRIDSELPIRAAIDCGITVFDTARAYPGNEERLRILPPNARVVTKGGMALGWRPDGRAKSILADCEASLRALDRPIDLYLLHAPDPRVALATSVRALASLMERKLVPRIGLCNVNRKQLLEALDLAPLTAIQVSLHEGALEGGVVSLALERGLWVMAHSPLGGVKRAKRIEDPRRLLAGILALHPRMIAIPGATRPETVRDSASAASLVLSEEERRIFVPRLAPPRASAGDGEVVMIAGLSGAGKSTRTEELAGYTRLNRDTMGGSLAKIAAELERRLAAGERKLVLDNTYVTRKSRHAVLAAAARHGVPVRCLWIEIPLAEAQRNVIERILAAHGRLLGPDELDGAPDRLPPRALYNQSRQLEPPELDEGFASLEIVRFSRTAREGGAGRAIALDVFDPALIEGPTLVFGWLPEGADRLLEATRGLSIDRAACTHPGGPPICWCRPPLPGLLLQFMHQRKLAQLTVHGCTPAHRQLAAAIGAPFVNC